jgi:hypothetical protein
MSKNSVDYINNAKLNLEIAQKSFFNASYEHELDLLERVKQDIEKAIELAKIEMSARMSFK